MSMPTPGWRGTGVVITAITLLALGPSAAAGNPPTGSDPYVGTSVVSPSPGVAFGLDAPDPDVVRVGSTYYGFTTGTTWGNNLGVLIDTSGDPSQGWRTLNGHSYGSTALPSPPNWQRASTQTSPGVVPWAGRWLLYYDAFDTALGHYCLSVAISSDPEGPYSDTSTQPITCQTDIGGSIDPSPFIDPATGALWLQWKSNDGSSRLPAYLWSAPLSADGLSIPTNPSQILAEDTVNHPWETTIENPDMIVTAGSYVLLFSGGAWDSANYAEGYAVCSGPAGPCSQPQTGPVLTSYGSVAGPGGGSLFTSPDGTLWMVFHGWSSNCTSYSCGGARQMHVGTAQFPAFPNRSNMATTTVATIAPTPSGHGYWLVAADGGIFAYGDAGFFGSMGSTHLSKPMVGIAPTPSGHGYWLVAADGGIFAYGDAGFFGSTGSITLNRPIVGIAPTRSGYGYWLVAADGGIFAYGDAGFFGSTGSITLNRPIIGIAPTPSGRGYWLVAADGGIFAYGDAGFFGSTGSITLNRPIVGIAPTPSGHGYWLVAADGGIFAYGDAGFFGSTGSITLNRPIVGIAPTPSGHGYWLVAADGGIFAYGDAGFFGSTAGQPM